MIQMQRAAFVLALMLAFGLAGCGLGRDSASDGEGVTDPIVAATVNGRPIYTEDVRAYAVATGRLEEGQDLDANSDAAFQALEEMIQTRLFAMEAEARGNDREPHIRRQLELARERVLAAAIYEEINDRATDPEAIEQLYRENTSRLGQGQEIHLRHIQFESREAAEAAKRRLDQGERFEALAFELSTDRATAPDGGDFGWAGVSDLNASFREATEPVNVGEIAGPIQIEANWHLIRVEDRRERGADSLETLRPLIVNWLRFQEISLLHESLARGARIERLREPDEALEPDGQIGAPVEAEPIPAPESGAEPRPGQPEAPPFPFPMGPGGVYGAQPAQPQTQTPSPAP